MSLKRLAVALLAMFVLGAIAANSASAENNWIARTGSWYTGSSPGTKLTVGTGIIDLVLAGKASFLTSTIAGSAIRFDSTSVEGHNCSARNPTPTMATIDCGALEFNGVSVSGPAATGCSASPFIPTNPITGNLGMNRAGTLATLEILPKAGSGSALATIQLVGSCANQGSYKLTGVIYAQFQLATETFFKTQELSTSELIQRDAGTATSLKFGGNAAFLNSRIGATTGIGTGNWAAKES